MKKLNLEFNEGDLIIADDFNQIVGEVNSQYDAIETVTSQISNLGGSVQSIVTQVNTLDNNMGTVTSALETVNSTLGAVSSEVNGLKTKIKFHVGTLEERDLYEASSGDIWMAPSYLTRDLFLFGITLPINFDTAWEYFHQEGAYDTQGEEIEGYELHNALIHFFHPLEGCGLQPFDIVFSEFLSEFDISIPLDRDVTDSETVSILNSVITAFNLMAIENEFPEWTTIPALLSINNYIEVRTTLYNNLKKLMESEDEPSTEVMILKPLDLLYFLGHINHNFKVFCSSIESIMYGSISVINSNALIYNQVDISHSIVNLGSLELSIIFLTEVFNSMKVYKNFEISNCTANVIRTLYINYMINSGVSTIEEVENGFNELYNAVAESPMFISTPLSASYYGTLYTIPEMLYLYYNGTWFIKDNYLVGNTTLKESLIPWDGLTYFNTDNNTKEIWYENKWQNSSTARVEINMDLESVNIDENNIVNYYIPSSLKDVEKLSTSSRGAIVDCHYGSNPNFLMKVENVHKYGDDFSGFISGINDSNGLPITIVITKENNRYGISCDILYKDANNFIKSISATHDYGN